MAVGTKIELQGESDYKKALSEITDNLKLLNSEMKVVTTSFDKNNASTNDLSNKNDVLNKKLDEQNKALAEAKKMLDEAKTSTDSNAETIAKWQIEVNKAQAEVNKTTQEIEKNTEVLNKMEDANVSNTQELKKFEEEEKKAGDSSLKLGDIIKANLISEAIIGGIKALASGISNVASSMGDALKGGAEYADNILTLSTQTGIATDKLQKYQAVSELTDVSMDTLTGSMSKMVKGLETNADNYKKLGVSIYDANGKLKDSEDIFNETLGALGKMKNETERDAMAMDLFGKSAQDLNPLIAMGTDGLNELMNSAEQMGAVLSEDGLSALGELDDQMQIFASTTGATGNILAVAFAPAVSSLIGNVNDLGAGFNYLISSIVSGDEGGIEEASNILSESVTMMVENIAEQVPAIMEIARSLIITLANVIRENLPTLIEGGLSMVLSLIGGIRENIHLIIYTITDVLGVLITTILENLPMLLAMGMEILNYLLVGISENLPTIIPVMINSVMLMVETLLDNIDMIIETGVNLIFALAEGLIEALPDLIDKVPVIIDKLIQALTNNIPYLIEMGVIFIVELAKGLIKAIPNIVKAIPQIITSIVNGLGSGLDKMKDVGKNLLQGLWEGMKNLGTWLWDKVKGLLGGLTDKIKNFFGIHSPSTLFKDEIGTNLALGIGEGFEDTMSDVNEEMANAVQTDYDLNVNTNLARAGATNTYDVMLSAFKEALKDVKVVMNDREMGTFVTDTIGKVVYN